jgi:hypothetical protein
MMYFIRSFLTNFMVILLQEHKGTNVGICVAVI